MPRDIERALDSKTSASTIASDATGDALPEPDKADRPLTQTRSRVVANAADPELLRYRDRLDQQLAAWRSSKSGTGPASAAKPRAPGLKWQMLNAWIAPIAACGAAAFAGWWLASTPAARTGEELARIRQALQEEQDRARTLVVTLSAAWRDLGTQAAALADRDAQEQERGILQKALQQSEAAAASLAQSLAEERFRSQDLERQLAAHPETTPGSIPVPSADRTSDNPSAEKADPELLRLLSRATLLVAQGDIGGARVVLERAAETGSASALFALAETFDPAILSAWGTVGTQGDPAWARELYAKALAGGIAAATERLAALKR